MMEESSVKPFSGNFQVILERILKHMDTHIVQRRARDFDKASFFYVHEWKMEYAFLENRIFCCISLAYTEYEYSKTDSCKHAGPGLERSLQLVRPIHPELIHLIKNN